jgi:hypothetical protein
VVDDDCRVGRLRLYARPALANYAVHQLVALQSIADFLSIVNMAVARGRRPKRELGRLMMRKRTTISPLKDAPLRNPGQSLDVQIDDLTTDMLGPILIATMFITLSAMEWFRWYRNDRPHPLFFSLVAGLGIIYAIFKTRRSWKRLQSMKLGRDGERAVGQYLEQVREAGARVFHDIVGKDFNLDHVVLSTKGFFVVETKTWSKPARGDAKITYDGEAIRANGQTHDRDPIKQAISQAAWLRDLLKESTGRSFPVKPVIVFPGWYVDSAATRGAKARGVWLLNPKVLTAFIAAEHGSITTEDVKLAAYHLGRYVRMASGYQKA